VSESEAQWRAWYDREALEDEPIPCDYERSMSAVERLLMVRCWRPERAVHEAHKYIGECLGRQYVTERCELDLATLAHDGHCRSPLVGLISAAADPTSGIEAAAKKLKIGECRRQSSPSCRSAAALCVCRVFLRASVRRC